MQRVLRFGQAVDAFHVGVGEEGGLLEPRCLDYPPPLHPNMYAGGSFARRADGQWRVGDAGGRADREDAEESAVEPASRKSG